MSNRKNSYHLFKALKNSTDDKVLYQAESSEQVCKLIDNFIDEIKEPARTQISDSLKMGLVDGFLSLEQWKNDVDRECPAEFKDALLGNLAGFTRSKLLVTCEKTKINGKPDIKKFSFPAPYNPMLHRIEAGKEAKAKYGSDANVVSINVVTPSEKVKANEYSL